MTALAEEGEGAAEAARHCKDGQGQKTIKIYNGLCTQYCNFGEDTALAQDPIRG